MTTTGKNRIMIFGPKADGTYVIEFKTAAGEALAISIPRTQTAVNPAFSGMVQSCGFWCVFYQVRDNRPNLIECVS
jgi:hypothetical protein